MASQDFSPDSESTELALLHSDPVLVQRGLEVVDVLGVGGNSIVYRAHDPRHGRDVAVKVLRSDVTSEVALARFQREVRVAGGLRHRHILPLFDSGVLADGRPFAVMPIAQGRPLRAMIDEGPLAIADALRLVSEIGDALTYLHARGWVHRDVKPENILVEGGHAVLTDFGIASRIEHEDDLTTILNPGDGSGDHDSRLTQTGKVVGTPAYMSPEVLSGDGPIDALADVYALGVVFDEMLTGSAPHRSKAASSSWNPSATLALRRRDIPPALAAVAARATAPKRSERFATVQQFTDALHGIRPIEPGGSAPPVVRRDFRNWLAAAFLAVALMVGVVGVNQRHAVLPDPNRVVVADFNNETGRPSLESLGELAGDLVVAALSRSTDLTVINSAVALGTRQRSPTPAAESILTASTLSLVRQTRAGIVVTGSYFIEGAKIGIMAEVSDARSGRVLGVVGPLAVDSTRTEQGFEVVGDSVASVVRRRYIPPDTVPRR